MNIYEKLLAIQTEIGNVNKNLIVGEGRSSYKAVGEADVLKAVKELENRYKIFSYPFDRQIIVDKLIEVEKDYKGTITRSTMKFIRIEVTYAFLNVENPEEVIYVKSYGDGIDSQDKAPGKAMTYADKYALLKTYKIVTGDDPDQKASEVVNELDENKTIDLVQQNALIQFIKSKEIDMAEVTKVLARYNIAKVKDIKVVDLMSVYKDLGGNQ